MENKGLKEIIINLTPEQKEELHKAVLKDIERNPFIAIESESGSVEIIEPEVNKTEAMNIFNELLEWWYNSEQTIIHDRSVEWHEDYKELEKDKADYIKRFKEALGVSDHGE